MHGPLWSTHIHSTNAQLCTQQWSNGGAARAIVAHHELLQGDLRQLPHPANHLSQDRSGGISLVAVALDDNAFAQNRLVLCLVFAHVIGMKPMSTVTAPEGHKNNLQCHQEKEVLKHVA